MATPLDSNQLPPTTQEKPVADKLHNHGYDRHDDGRMHQDLHGVSIALANLHGDLREHTIDHQSSKTLSKGVGGLIGFISTFTALAKVKDKSKFNGEKIAQAISKVFDNGDNSTVDEDRISFTMDHKFPDFIKSLKLLSQQHKSDAPEFEATKQSIDKQLQEYFRESVAHHLEGITGKSSPQVAYNYYVRFIKDKINAQFDKDEIFSREDPLRKNSINMFLKLNCPEDRTKAYDIMRDAIEKREHGPLENWFVMIAGVAAGTTAAAYVGAAIHHVIDRERKHKIDALTDEVNGLNRIMVAHNLPTADMSKIPAKTYGERTKQIEAIEQEDKERHIAAIKEARAKLEAEQAAHPVAATKSKDTKHDEASEIPQAHATVPVHYDGTAAQQMTQQASL
jgi:hypothetical protein